MPYRSSWPAVLPHPACSLREQTDLPAWRGGESAPCGAGRRVSSPRGGEVKLAAAHRASDLALGVALGDRFPLVVLLLATCQADLDLRVVPRKVHAQRDQRVSLLPHLPNQARDFLAMEQELARTQRLVVHEVRLRVGRDVHVFQPRLVAIDPHEPVPKVRAPIANRLHLGTCEHDPRLELLVDEVVVVRAAVNCDISLTLVLAVLLIFVSHRAALAPPSPAR